MAFTYLQYTLEEGGEPGPLPDEHRRCIVDGGALSVPGPGGDDWKCDQNPVHTYRAYQRLPDKATIFVAYDSGISTFLNQAVAEVCDLNEVVTMSLGINQAVSEGCELREVVTMAIV